MGGRGPPLLHLAPLVVPDSALESAASVAGFGQLVAGFGQLHFEGEVSVGGAPARPRQAAAGADECSKIVFHGEAGDCGSRNSELGRLEGRLDKCSRIADPGVSSTFHDKILREGSLGFGKPGSVRDVRVRVMEELDVRRF